MVKIPDYILLRVDEKFKYASAEVFQQVWA